MARELTLDGFDEPENGYIKETADGKRPIRLIHKPGKAEYEKMKTTLRQCTKAALQMKAVPLINLMKKYSIRYEGENGRNLKPQPIYQLELSKTQPKETWVEMLAIFYCEENFHIIFENMSEREKEVLRKVVSNDFLIDTDVNKIMDENCFIKTHWYGEYELKVPLAHHFNFKRMKGDINGMGSSRKLSNFIYLGYVTQYLLLKALFPELTNIKGLDTLPDDMQLKTYNGENLVFAKLPVLASLYDTKVLGNGYAKITATTAKKAQKVLAMPDFFTNFPDSKQPPLSTALMANHYLFYRVGKGGKELPASPELTIKDIFKKVQNANEYTLSVWLPYMKGIKKSLIWMSYLDFVTGDALSLLKTHNEKGWLPIDALIMKIRTYDENAENKFLILSTYNIEKMDLRNGYADDCYIHPGNIVKQLSEPFVKALMFLLATYGIVEIAYREPAEGDTSYYDGLRYVRLTELGRFVMGITKKYVPHVDADMRPAFELDDQRLMIKVLRGDSPFVPLLNDYADCITPTLYKVNYDSFLRGCSDADSVRRKAELFSQYICKSQPQVWKQFFKDVTERATPFTTPYCEYTILCIPPDKRELQRIVLTEPSIRKYVLKAENFMLLVKTDEMKAFASALRKFGYLL